MLETTNIGFAEVSLAHFLTSFFGLGQTRIGTSRRYPSMMKTLAVGSAFVGQNYRPGTQEAKRAWRSDDDIDEEVLEECCWLRQNSWPRCQRQMKSTDLVSRAASTLQRRQNDSNQPRS